MKTIVNVTLVCALFSSHLAAQRGQFAGSASGLSGWHSGGRPAAPFGRPGAARLPRTGFRLDRAGYAFPWYSPWIFPSSLDFGPWGGFGDEYQPPQVTLVMPQPEAPPLPPPPPPEPARPVIHEYSWPSASVASAGAFSLVWKDGTVHFAIAVWVQDGVVYYSMQDGTPGRQPLDAVDRAATRVLNASNGLNLSLPPVTTNPLKPDSRN